MSRAATILRNVASNWVGFAVNAGVALVLTPFVLHELGVGRYGIWILTSSIIGYYGLLDLGFRAGVNQYLTRYLAMRDYAKASECLSTAVAALSALGLVMVMLSVAAAYLAPRLFEFPAEIAREGFWCILIVGLTSAIQFGLCPYAAMFSATQRFDLANLIGVCTRLLAGATIFTALRVDLGLIGISAATCLTSLIDNLIRWRVSRSLAPEVRVSLHMAKFERLREIYSFGAWNFLVSINAYICSYVPNILIGAFMSIAAVGHYSLANGLSRQINSVLSPVGQVMYPAATEMHTRDDRNGLERLYHDGSRLMMLVMIPTLLIAWYWAEDFFRLWIGESYLSGKPFHSVALLFKCLLIGTFTTYFSHIGAQILVGSGRVKLLALVLVSGSVLSVCTSMLLIGPYGLVGVAMAVAIASVVVDMIAIPLILQRFMGLAVMDFLLHASMRPLAAGLLQAVGIVCIRLLGRPGDWSSLVLQGVLAGIWVLAIALVVGVTPEERQRFLQRPVCRLLGKEQKVGTVRS